MKQLVFVLLLLAMSCSSYGMENEKKEALIPVTLEWCVDLLCKVYISGAFVSDDQKFYQDELKHIQQEQRDSWDIKFSD